MVTALRIGGIATLVMFGASIGMVAAALCKAAANGDRVIEDNSGYPGTPTPSRPRHPSTQGTSRQGSSNHPPTPRTGR